MRCLCIAVALSLGMAHLAAAQQDNTVAVPPAPAIVAAPSSPTTAPLPPPEQPPGLVQTPAPPANADSGAAPPPAQTTPPQPPNTWVPGTTAKLGVLNKVDGSVSAISIPVGGQANIGDLTVSVLACVNRPADQIPDTAIFLNAQSTTADPTVPTYRGWLVLSAPGAAVVGDASETFRVIACS